jgi:predicted unusual protein kinase regulating ubiquinone biosynthesis (AarF/ABC1/UbiB family)
MRAADLGRFKDIGLLLVKHRHLAGGVTADPGEAEAAGSDAEADAAELAEALEQLGPTFVKLGQVLSTRADLLPPVYLEALSRLQDRVAPFGFAEVEEIVTRELGVRLSKGFRTFESEPMASASLGQVHRAELRDGRPVAVKVQRPDIRAQIERDMEVIADIASLADDHTEAGRRLGFSDMVEEFRRSLMAELDYRQEADNLITLGANLADHALIVVPQPVADYSTDLVLTMDLVSGRSLNRITPIGRSELDGAPLAAALFSAYLDQILVHGLFHADPHPGNVLVTDDGRLALLDLGMVARVAPELQDQLIKLLLAVGEGRGRDAADVAVSMGRPLEGFDGDRFRDRAAEMVHRVQGATLGQLQAGQVVAELTQIAAQSSLRLPAELTMLGKALLNLDETARILDPTFDPNDALQREASEVMRKKLLQSASPGNLIGAALEAKEFAERLPGRVNQVMDALAEGKLTLNVQGIDEREIMRSAQKLANRIAASVVVASLVIGAALIMRIRTDAELFGYPALAIVLFLIAAAAGLWLLISIQLSDLPQRRRGGRRRAGD